MVRIKPRSKSGLSISKGTANQNWAVRGHGRPGSACKQPGPARRPARTRHCLARVTRRITPAWLPAMEGAMAHVGIGQAQRHDLVRRHGLVDTVQVWRNAPPSPANTRHGTCSGPSRFQPSSMSALPLISTLAPAPPGVHRIVGQHGPAVHPPPPNRPCRSNRSPPRETRVFQTTWR